MSSSTKQEDTGLRLSLQRQLDEGSKVWKSVNSSVATASTINQTLPNTKETFLRFVNAVLEAAEMEGDIEITPPKPSSPRRRRRSTNSKRESPLNSVGESNRDSARSSTSSVHSSASLDEDIESNEYDESWGMVTCWCGKPYAGRAMIECEECLVWLHLTCANIRRTNIPKHFKCSRCRPPKKRRRSGVSDMKEDAPESQPSSSPNPKSPLSHSFGVDIYANS